MKKLSQQAKRHSVKKAMKGQRRWTTPRNRRTMKPVQSGDNNAEA